MNKTIFDLSTGRPVARGVGVVAAAGCVAVDGLHDMETSQLVERPDDFGSAIYAVEQTLPPRPADSEMRTWAWDDAAGDWVPSLTLAGHRAARWSRLKQARDAAEAVPLLVGGRAYDADADSQRRIAGAVQLALMAALAVEAVSATPGEPPTQEERLAALDAAGWAINWTLSDNSVATLTAAEMITVGVALGEQVAAAHATGRTLRAQLDAAETVSQINAVKWPAS